MIAEPLCVETRTCPTPDAQRAFAGRFSLDDWAWLCRRQEFLDAMQNDLTEAEIIADELLQPTK